MPTIRFPWVPASGIDHLLITKIGTPATTQISNSMSEVSPGIFEAIFTTLVVDGDYYITPRIGTVNQDGVGTVFGLTNDSATYLETELLAPGAVTISQGNIDDIADGVVDAIQAIPGFSVEVISPVNTRGEIEITQGDAYLVANSRNLQVGLTGALPSLESICTFRFFFGGTVVTVSGTVVVVSATNYTLKCDLTGIQTAAMPVGTFQYEVEVTYFNTTNKWTPSKGRFTVEGQL